MLNHTDLEAFGLYDEKVRAAVTPANRIVRQFRQIVLWPLQLVDGSGARGQADELLQKASGGVWQLVEDEFGCGANSFQERHYREFVSFLPHVQRFLYGDVPGPARGLGYGDAPLRVLRRSDIKRVRFKLTSEAEPIELEVVHADLHFFYDVDVVILAVEIAGRDIPLETAQAILHRLGRAYPPGWSESGEPQNTCAEMAWIGADGAVMARSDYGDRQRYLDFVGEQRAPYFASHWQFLLAPMVPHPSPTKAPLSYRQIEYYRMPTMAFLALDGLDGLTRADYVRLTLASAPGDPQSLPFTESHLAEFEKSHCYDRFHAPEKTGGGPSTRFLTCGHAFTVVSDARQPFVTDPERGLLAQVRHQYYLLFLIAHFHKAALLMLSDRLVATIKKLDVSRARTIRQFRRETYDIQEVFLRFTHRYWFSDISDQAQSRDLFRMLRQHLALEATYRDLRSEILDMGAYQDSDMLRRQSSTMLRLTVVTILGLIGTTVTGFLGMNLIAEAEAPPETKLTYFMAVLIPTVILMLVTLRFSRTFVDLMEWIAGDRRRTGR